ncbi:hypothetical protein [Leucobacter sp. W1038]|uniref:hypothetical protein n=1 Tax=Leucobacter sp. W1038 TaxID=3438281 RepID=UPI003D989577
MVVQGILFPEDWLTTDWFSIFATVVAINTLVYVVLGVSKLLPVWHLKFFKRDGRNRRGETRSIYPDAKP